MDDRDLPSKTAGRAFERKILRARLVAVFEQIWLRLWLVLAVAAAFVLVSYANVWAYLPPSAHMALLGAFGLAFLVALVQLARVTWPSRDDAIRRIERASNIPHRPASSYEDTVSAGSDPATLQIWQAHRNRMAALIQRLRPGKPRPRTDRFDPFALRAATVLALVGLTGLLGPTAIERMRSAFTFGSVAALAQARLDAWLTPPTYTAKPPVMLADGSRNAGVADGNGEQTVYEAPIKSVLIVRVGGMGEAPLALEVLPAVAKGETLPPERIDSKAEADTGDLKEVRYEMKRSATVRVVSGSRELARWPITVTPDQVPRISLSRPPELTPRGSLKLTYKVEDDYGVVAAGADLKRLKDPPKEDKNAWARPPLPKGPRAPLLRPPKLELRLPKTVTSGEAHTYFEMASHPWAGRKVIMTLTAKDAAGQVGKSPGFEMILPEKAFTKPLARAIVEQRKKLMEDSRYRPTVVKALDALTLEPEGFIDDTKVYLGLRTARHRLKGDRSRAAYKSVIDQLWQIALRIEDGSLSDAERALKDAQDKLAKALENGASDEEIKQLMQELRQALNEFMKQLAQENGNQQQDGQNQDQQTLGQQDLERMMQNLEDMAKSGSREQAQQMLSEMQDLMERLQSGRQDQAQAQRNQEMMKMMEELGTMVGDQQKLMDETFGKQAEQNEDNGGQDGRQQKPPPGMKGMGSAGAGKGAGAPPGQQDDSMQGRGQRGQQPQPGEQAQQQGEGSQLGQGNNRRGGLEDLSRRQRELRDRLGQLQKGMREKGGPSSQQLADAENAMESAEDALERGDLEEATEQQSRALDQMRQGAQNMAQEMMRNMPQRYGQSGDTPRDPLGRPQRSQGPDLGTSVKVPDQIDVQRAREILEELRRRLGEARRAPVELDYLERLLRRF